MVRKEENSKNGRTQRRSASRITDYFEGIDATNSHELSLFLDSLRLTEKKYRMESLERGSTRKYDALKKHKGLKGRRLIGKTLGFEKLVSNERRIGRKEIRRRTKDG